MTQDLFEAVLASLVPGWHKGWNEYVGSSLYHRFQRIRLKQLRGEVKVFGTDHKIEYTRIEQGRSKRLIFLPGFADTKENFYNSAQFLIKEFDIVIPDLPGFGHSFKQAGEKYSLSNYAKWMVEFIEHIGWTDFHLVGNSLGGAVAVELALAMPEKIKSLVLADCGGVVFRDQPSIYQEFVNGRFIFHINSALQFRYFLERVFHKPPLIPPLVWAYLYREYSRHSRWHRKMLHDLLDNIESMDDPRLDEAILNERIREISVPTLIVWGEEDTFFPVCTADFMHERIKNSQLEIIPNCGHGPHAEKPLLFARLVKTFISRLP